MPQSDRVYDVPPEELLKLALDSTTLEAAAERLKGVPLPNGLQVKNGSPGTTALVFRQALTAIAVELEDQG